MTEHQCPAQRPTELLGDWYCHSDRLDEQGAGTVCHRDVRCFTELDAIRFWSKRAMFAETLVREMAAAPWRTAIIEGDPDDYVSCIFCEGALEKIHSRSDGSPVRSHDNRPIGHEPSCPITRAREAGILEKG